MMIVYQTVECNLPTTNYNRRACTFRVRINQSYAQLNFVIDTFSVNCFSRGKGNVKRLTSLIFPFYPIRYYG